MFTAQTPDGRTFRVDARTPEEAGEAVDEMMEAERSGALGQGAGRRPSDVLAGGGGQSTLRGGTSAPGGMPSFRVVGRDGKSYRVQAANPERAAALVGEMLSSRPPAAGAAPQMGAVEDIARSAATGLGEGATQSVGLLGDLQSGFDQFGAWVGDALGLPPLSEAAKAGFAAGRAPTTADIERATGFDQIKHEPQTTAGEFTRTAASFAGPAAVAGLGKGAVRTAVKYGVVPGVASEAAGQATEGTAIEPLARAAGALTAGGVAAFLSRPTTASAALKKAMPPDVTINDVVLADNLMASGRSAGLELTWPEALHHVTGGRVDITNLQRILEQTTGGAPVLSPMMADRPKQVARGMTNAMDDLTSGARMTTPEGAGLGIQRSAEDSLDHIRKRINEVSEPFYDAARDVQIPDDQFKSLIADPLYRRALREVRRDPVHSRFVRGLPNDTVGVQNEVKKWFDRQADLAAPANDKTAASVYGGLGRNVRDVAKQAAPDYERALGLESVLRQKVLGTAEAGPLGGMARTSDIGAQGKALFPDAPVEGSQQAIREAVGALASRSPDQAFQLVRTSLRRTFDETTQSLISGGNQWGGAKFAAAIRGNTQQARNLEAAVRALPDGDSRWKGLNTFLEVLEATGRRRRPNSMTAYDTEALNDLKRGGLVAETARTVRSLGSRLWDFYDKFKLGKNTAQLAQIITDPQAGKMLADLSRARTPAGQRALAGYLVLYYAGEAPRTMQRQEKAAQPPARLR